MRLQNLKKKKNYIIEKRIFTEIVKFTNENDLFCEWRDFKKKCTYDKWNFKPKISSIFHIERVNDGWVSQILLMFFVQIYGACLLKKRDFVKEINQFQWYYRVFLRFCEHLLLHSAVPGIVNGKSIKDYLLRILKHQLDSCL